jgi:hypothetical protein
MAFGGQELCGTLSKRAAALGFSLYLPSPSPCTSSISSFILVRFSVGLVERAPVSCHAVL